jgi:hypothetical protein
MQKRKNKRCVGATKGACIKQQNSDQSVRLRYQQQISLMHFNVFTYIPIPFSILNP